MPTSHSSTPASGDDQSVLVIGEALVDLVVGFGKGEQDAEAVPGGSPANVALALGRLGIPVELVTWVGKDDYGKQITAHLQESKVTVGEASQQAVATPRATAWLNQEGAATYSFDIEWQPASPIPVPTSVAVVHTGSIASVLAPGAQTVIEALREAQPQSLITFDPNARPQIMGSVQQARETVEQIVALSDVIKVSDEDLEWFYPHLTIDEVVQKWTGEFGVELVVLTRGSQGPLATTRSGATASVVPAEVTVIDTVGAGDTFMGGLIDALWRRGVRGPLGREALAQLSQEQLEQVLQEASLVADIVVQRRGANPPWASELGR